MAATTNPLDPQAPVFLCVLRVYNNFYYDDDNTAPLWEYLTERFVATRNAARAETVFIETLKKEEAYLPPVYERQIQVVEWTGQWQEHYSEKEILHKLILDPEQYPDTPDTDRRLQVTINQIRKHKNRATKALLTYAEEESKKLDQKLTIEQAGSELHTKICTEWVRLAEQYHCTPQKLKFSTSQRYRKEVTDPFEIWGVWGFSNGGEYVISITVKVAE